ncbi:MAG: DNA repair protein RecN, partial [Chitinophagaceae bacterium]
EELRQRLSVSVIELSDITSEIERLGENVVYDAERIQIISDRLAEGYRLQKKHDVKDTQGLLDRQAELEARLSQMVTDNEKIDVLEKDAAKLEVAAMQLASEISEKRKKEVEGFVKKVNLLLKQVGMPNARLMVNVSKGDLEVHGIDAVSFLFNANVPAGQDATGRFEPLGKVASGGERSRLMLSIKSLVAKKLQLPTLIFDEIDSGISGEAAKQVGNIMKELSANHQIISITHQAQVAAKADAHYFVFKEMQGQGIHTAIKKLDIEERVKAIARMLSGEQPTAAALENAREMVENE